MSLLSKFKYIWAQNTGSVGEAPDDEKIQEGFVKELLEFERLNWIAQRHELAIDNIVTEVAKGYSDSLDASEAKFAISSGLFSTDDWGGVKNSKNNVYGGATTKAYVDCCVAYNAQTNTPLLLALDNTNKKIDVFDTRAGTLIDTSDALTADLPTPGGESWQTYSMASDGTSVYVFCTDTGNSPNTHQVQAWDIATWDVKDGWPTTGRALSGTGTRRLQAGRDIIIASSTHLVVANSWTPISSSVTACMSALSLSDGSVTTSGAGNGTAGYYINSVASDGTNVLFAHDNTTNAGLGTATLADLSVGSGGTGYPLSLSTEINTHVISMGTMFASCNSVAGTAASDSQAATRSLVLPQATWCCVPTRPTTRCGTSSSVGRRRRPPPTWETSGF
jgi:hypothetical protein